MRRASDFCIERLGVKRHDYRRTLGHKRSNPAGVVKMMMGRNCVTDRFAGESLFDRLDHGRGAGFIKRPFNGDQMITHLDQDRRMGAALNSCARRERARPIGSRARVPYPDS